MFTINVKGYRNPRDLEMVKLKLIFFKTGYARVPKIIPISGRYDDWNPKRQLFDGNTKDIYERNQLILKEKFKYRKIAEKWESDGKDWIPKELSHYYEQDSKKSIHYITVSDMLDNIVQQFCCQERYKNGHVLTSYSTANKYKCLKNILCVFPKGYIYSTFVLDPFFSHFLIYFNSIIKLEFIFSQRFNNKPQIRNL